MELFYLFEIHHLLVLVLGLGLGIVVGALPGLTPTMGVALTIPFTFSLGATEGLIILGGIYCGSVYGGSIPAILFNVPGAPANVATTFDGYAMTKKGQSRKALELATISSVIGGLFGMILLLYFAPVFTTFSLQFGPSQTFWIALFGITVIAAISDGSVSKNLIGGCIGILLSFIGISTVTGTARFTFGFESFIGGLHIVAILIGLFAFPQALRMIEDLTLNESSKPKLKPKQLRSSIRKSVIDIFKRPRALITGSTLGAFIGMIPGAGGNIASILAYNETKRFSKAKESYGTGEKNGIISSEAANNAMVGGSLVPLLTLGIPGSPTAAIFLGGLLIHGIWPGSNLFIDNSEVAYTFLYSMVIAQILLLFLGLFMIRFMTNLSYIPSYIMAPVILSFSIIGAYTTQNNTFDIYTVVIVGFLMFLLQKAHFSPAPIALGFILGTIAEEGFLQGVQIGSANGSPFGYFFSGGWNIVLSSLVMITIVFSFVQYRLKKRNSGEARDERNRGVTWRNLVSQSATVWLLIIVASLISLFLIFEMRFEQRIFPQLTLGFLALFSFIEYGKAILNNRKREAADNLLFFNKHNLILMVFLIGLSLISLLTTIIGYYTQVFMLMLAVPIFTYFLKKNTIKLGYVFITAGVFTFVLYIVFTLILKVPLPNISIL